MSNQSFIVIQGAVINLFEIAAMTLRTARDEFGQENPNLGFDLAVQIKNAAEPMLFRFPTQSEVVALKNELEQRLRDSGCDVRHYD